MLLVGKRKLRKIIAEESRQPSEDSDLNADKIARFVDQLLRQKRAGRDLFGEDLQASFNPRADRSPEARARMEKVMRISSIWSFIIVTDLSVGAAVLATWFTR